jgi:hypothetical protein
MWRRSRSTRAIYPDLSGHSPVAIHIRARKTFPLEENMSPKAIKSLIDMFGVEHGVQILNLFTAPEDEDIILQAQSSIRNRPKELLRDVTLPREIPLNQ